MAGQPSRRQAPASHNDTSDWMRRRNAHVQAGREAEAAGRRAWSQSTRSGEHLDAAHPSEVHALGRQVLRQGLRAITHQPSIIEEELHALDAFQKASPIPQPNFLESGIPVVGPAWEFAADVQRRRYGHAVLDVAAGALDLPIEKAAAKGIARVLKDKVTVPRGKSQAPYRWKRVRAWMGDEGGYLQPYQHGHHGIIPQNGWGKKVPEAIKNHPLNIKGMPDRVTHERIHGRSGRLPRFNPVERYVHGTPDWWKATHASAAGHGAMAATHSERRK